MMASAPGHMEGPAVAGFACRLCGADDLRFFYSLGNAGEFRYYRCGDCGLVNYDLAGGLDQAQYVSVRVDPHDARNPRNQDNLRTFRFLERHLAPGRLLDVGCGNGHLLLLARRGGWEVKGLELAPDMARFVEERTGIEVVAGDFLTMEPSPAELGSYDVVSLRHVLEHLPFPLEAMARIRALLRPGGYFLAEMPNIDGLSRRWRRFLANSGLHHRRFPAGFSAGHCCEYSRRSFEALMARAGFELLHWETYTRKPLGDWLLNRIPIGTKARALARRVDPAVGKEFRGG